jgi:hypothetical protein
MPSDAQIIYSIVLIVLIFARGGFLVWALVLNMCAYFAASYAMDIHIIARDNATAWFAVIDAVTCVFLAFRPSPARVVALFYAIRVHVYMANLLFGVSTDTTFAIVWAIVALQVGVVIIGTPTGTDGIKHRRVRPRVDSFVLQKRNEGMDSVSVALVSQAGE